MSSSRRLSNASVPCRLEWRPSYWLVGAQAALGLLGALSALASGMPRVAAWGVAVTALLAGVWSAMREARRPRRRLHWSSSGQLALDGEPAFDPHLQWRGPLAFLGWRGADGRRHALAWWPDTLAAAQRRELRLAAARGVSAASRRSMAP